MGAMICFQVTGTVADLDETTLGEPWHPTFVLIIEVNYAYSRVVVPPAAWTAPRELLQVGRSVRVTGSVTDAYAPAVATRIEVIGALH